MLNASRHHRKNRRTVQRLQPVPGRSAQRLAASQEKSPCDLSIDIGFRDRCSTPRGITGKIAVFCVIDRPPGRLCSTPRGITGKIAPTPSAYRSTRLIPCSTPRGITGKIASRRRHTVDDFDCVLNASRHHRKNRLFRCCDGCHLVRCSTPRGITGKIALNVQNHRSNVSLRAQRLAASQEKSRGLASVMPMLSRWCSTPRGITGKIALRCGHVPQDATSVCSTPRGITGKIANRLRSRRVTPSPVLNASRHHRKNRPCHFAID